MEAHRITKSCTAESDADDYPDRAGKKAELRGQRRSDEWSRPGDRREVVAEDDPPVGRSVVTTVIESHRGRRSSRIEREDLARDELAVEPIRHRVRAESGDEKPRRIHGLAARQGEPREAGGAEQRDESPDDDRANASHYGVVTSAMKLSMR